MNQVTQVRGNQVAAPSRVAQAVSQATGLSHNVIGMAIDLGFGVVKYTRRARKNEMAQAVDGIVYDCFRSLAVHANERQTDVSKARQRDTVLVEYNGRSFEVGPEIHHAMSGDFGRDGTDGYYGSDVYHALMRGALVYMNETWIDTLVIGLPMNHYKDESKRLALEAAYTGVVSLGHGRNVNIGRVEVRPQPFGGYLGLGYELEGINAAISNYPESGINHLNDVFDLQKLIILLVDVGSFTLDWLLMTPGGLAEGVSGAASDSGRQRVIREVRKVLENLTKKPLMASFDKDIDDALRNDKRIKIAGKTFMLDGPEFAEVIDKAVESPVRQMLESLRGADDRVDLIVVVGGNPGDIANAIRKVRPDHPLYCASDFPRDNDPLDQYNPMFTNLRGFHDWAIELSEEGKQG